MQLRGSKDFLLSMRNENQVSSMIQKSQIEPCTRHCGILLRPNAMNCASKGWTECTSPQFFVFPFVPQIFSPNTFFLLPCIYEGLYMNLSSLTNFSQTQLLIKHLGVWKLNLWEFNYENPVKKLIHELAILDLK